MASKIYTQEELTTLFLEALHLTLQAHNELDKAYIKAKAEINEAYNARIRSYVENAEGRFH